MDASIALSDAFLYLQINLDQDLSDWSSSRHCLAGNNEAWEKENIRILPSQAAPLSSCKVGTTQISATSVCTQLFLNMWAEQNHNKETMAMLKAVLSVLMKYPGIGKLWSPNTCFWMYSWESLKSELWGAAASPLANPHTRLSHHIATIPLIT